MGIPQGISSSIPARFPSSSAFGPRLRAWQLLCSGGAAWEPHAATSWQLGSGEMSAAVSNPVSTQLSYMHVLCLLPRQPGQLREVKGTCPLAPAWWGSLAAGITASWQETEGHRPHSTHPAVHQLLRDQRCLRNHPPGPLLVPT